MKKFKWDKKMIWLGIKYIVNLIGLMFSMGKVLKSLPTSNSGLLLVATVAFSLHLGYTCSQLDGGQIKK